MIAQAATLAGVRWVEAGRLASYGGPGLAALSQLGLTTPWRPRRKEP